MRRLARVLLRAIAVACVVAAIVAGVFWPISYRYLDYAAVRISPQHGLAVAARQGRNYLGVLRIGGGGWGEVQRFSLGPNGLSGGGDPDGARLGFYAEFGPEFYAMFPTPVAILALLALATFAWLTARRLRPPIDPTRCRACGYDLRATPARCPECGTTA